VAVVEWVDPPFTAGHWIPDMVEVAGGRPVAARPSAPSVETTWADIAAEGPDYVLVAPCGYHLAGAVEQAHRATAALTDADRARDAGAAGRPRPIANLPGPAVWAVDADAIVVRPGPRLVEGVEAIAAILHPDAVPEPRAGAIQRIG
jgi:iron complex transport system substrate-binding protein